MCGRVIWVLIWRQGSQSVSAQQEEEKETKRRDAERDAPLNTWMVDNGHLAVGLLDLQLGGLRRDAEGVVVGRIDDHFG